MSHVFDFTAAPLDPDWTLAGLQNPAGYPPNGNGESHLPTHSPHHAFQVARICCRCREEKCCKPLESLMIQSIRDLGQRHLPPPPRSGTIHP